MPTQPEPLTLAGAVRRAVELCDPTDRDADLGDFLARFEDRDEPISSETESIEEEIAEALGILDPDGDLPALQMAGAVTTYLAFRRDEVTDNRTDILRLAAEAEYHGDVPPRIADWLGDQGVQV
jgi:hypothetical protein